MDVNMKQYEEQERLRRDAGQASVSSADAAWEITIPPSVRVTADWLGDQISAAAEQNDYPALLRFTRDRAFVLLNYFCMDDLGEISRLRFPDVSFSASALQIGGCRRKSIPASDSRFCPVAALRAWLSLSGIENGPIFRRVRGNGQLSREALFPGDLRNVFQQCAWLAKSCNAPCAEGVQ